MTPQARRPGSGGPQRSGTRNSGRREKTWQRWTPDEEAVVDRYVRAVFRGRYRNVASAAGDCTAALRRLWQRLPSSRRPAAPRAGYPVSLRMNRRAARLGQPRPMTRWTGDEIRVVDSYIRAVVRQRYASLAQAAVFCHQELKGHHGGRLDVRPPGSVCAMMYERSRKVGRFRLPRRRWSAEEKAISAKWVRKYDTERRRGPRVDITSLAGKLRAELDRRGFRRSLNACKSLLIGQRSLLLAKQHPGRR